MDNYRIVKGGVESGVTVYRIQYRSYFLFKNIINLFTQRPLVFIWKFVTCTYWDDPVEFTQIESAQRVCNQLNIDSESKHWKWIPINSTLGEQNQNDLF